MNVSLTFLSVAPEIAVAAAVVLLLMVEVTFKPRAAVWGAIAGAGLAAGAALSAWQWVAHRGADAGVFWHEMIAVDGFSALAGMLVFPLAGLGLMSAWRLAAAQRRRGAEFVALVMLAATGAHLMAASADLIMLFIGLEVFSLSLYVLAGFTRERRDADEASLKYFLLGAFASAVFLYGVALVFAATGTTTIYGPDGIADYLGGTIIFRPGVLLAGLALLLVGMAFKVSAAPFHVWAPDVYQGAPGGITGFLAASAKVAGFAALARVLTAALGARADDWVPAVAGLAAAVGGGGDAAGHRPGRCQAPAGLLLGGPRRLHPHRPGGRAGRHRRHVVLPGHLCRSRCWALSPWLRWCRATAPGGRPWPTGPAWVAAPRGWRPP